MDTQTIESNIDRAKDAQLEASQEYWDNAVDVELPKGDDADIRKDVERAPVDYYAKTQKAMRNETKKSRPRGSSAYVMAVVRDAVAGGDGREGLAQAYRRAKGYSESGEKERRELYKQRYMEEQFLPVVESVVNFTSPDELLNSSQALDELDKYAMGIGSGSGYTEAYVRAAYGDTLGQQVGKSDPTVAQAVRSIRNLAASDQIRAAYGLAQKIKTQIDNGEHMADDADYDLISRVAAYK